MKIVTSSLCDFVCVGGRTGGLVRLIRSYIENGMLSHIPDGL